MICIYTSEGYTLEIFFLFSIGVGGFVWVVIDEWVVYVRLIIEYGRDILLVAFPGRRNRMGQKT